MKLMQYPILAVIIQLTAANSYASLRTDVPKPKLGLTEAQINAIKNERGRPSKSASAGLFNEDNSEELEQLLQARLREVSHLTHFRDHTSLDKALTFSGLALQAWNPELRHTDTKTMIVKNIINYGFIEGFIVPTMAMMDASYAIGNEGFGNLMNVMLADITPNIAESFKKQYGVPTEVNEQSFHQITNQGRQGMWVALMSQLDPDFYKVHSEIEKQLVDGRLNPKKSNIKDTINKFITFNDQIDAYGSITEYDSKIKEAKVNDFINININGDRTAISNFLKKIGKEDKSAQLMAKRKLFSSEFSDSTKQCAMKCLDEVVQGAINGEAGGKALGKIGGKTSKGLIRLTSIIGAANGVDKCIASTECGGSKEQREEEKRKKEEAEKVATKEKQKYIDQYNDMIKKEANKKLQNDLMDDEKRKELEKKRLEYEKAKKETETTDSDENQDYKEEKPRWQENRDIKPMIADDEGTHVSQQDIQQKKEMATIPTIPDESGSRTIFAKNRYDLVVKTMTKEKSAENIKVNVVYPTNPNTGN